MKYLLVLSLILVCLIFSCNDENDYSAEFEVGESFTDSNLRVIQIDTLTLNVSTVKFDSIITSSSSRILLGKYEDPEFGVVSANSFFEVAPENYSIDNEAVFDSLVMFLKYDAYYYNDTLQYNEIHVKRVIQTLKPNQTAFYNTSKIEYQNADLGVYRYLPRPIESDTIHFRISDSLGLSFFENIQSKNITTDDVFKNYFKGIALTPGETDNGSVIGFTNEQDLCMMRLYYSIAGETEIEQEYLDISINKSSNYTSYFNQITAEYPNEYLQNINSSEDKLNSNDSENKTFIQAGIGYSTSIRFPHLKSLYDIPGKGTILEAILLIKPVSQSYSDLLSLTDTLNLYIADQNNQISSQLTYSDGTTLQAILNKEDQEYNNLQYEVPIGTYVEELFTTEGDSKNSIILLPNNYQSTVNRVVLNGSAGDDNIKLELIYTIYDEDEN